MDTEREGKSKSRRRSQEEERYHRAQQGREEEGEIGRHGGVQPESISPADQ